MKQFTKLRLPKLSTVIVSLVCFAIVVCSIIYSSDFQKKYNEYNNTYQNNEQMIAKLKDDLNRTIVTTTEKVIDRSKLQSEVKTACLKIANLQIQYHACNVDGKTIKDSTKIVEQLDDLIIGDNRGQWYTVPTVKHHWIVSDKYDLSSDSVPVVWKAYNDNNELLMVVTGNYNIETKTFSNIDKVMTDIGKNQKISDNYYYASPGGV